MKTKRTIPAAVALILALSLLFTACGGDTDGVYAQSVGALNGMGGLGFSDRFAGIVTAGRTVEIRAENGMMPDEIRVEEGQTVKKGDVLFTYNNEDATLRVEEARLEIEGLKNKIASSNAQIAELAKERDAAAGGEKLGYTLEIQSLQADIRETEYQITLKQKALAELEKTAADTVVKSETDGRVTQIRRPGNEEESGEDRPLMTIVETGNLRVKGTINELNRGAISEGEAVTIRSRTDPAAVWRGEVQSVDYSAPERSEGNGDMLGGEEDEMTSSSKYPFYVQLADAEGLIVGQHVYIEPGETAPTDPDGALRLPEAFVAEPEGGAPFVWAVNAANKLEKRRVELGAFDETTGEYEILDGLTTEDYVAFPDEALREGMAAIKTDFPVDDGTWEDGSGVFADDGGEWQTDDPEADGEPVPADDAAIGDAAAAADGASA